jgi:hypothetical protein
MKAITTFFILIFSITLMRAQPNAATPNNGFESWTHVSSNGGYDDPVSWNCLNPSTATFGVITCFKDSTNPHSGKYAAHLITQSVLSSITVPGALTTGTVNTTNYTINGGLPYTLRPDSIIGWYQYVSQKGDNGDCEFYLFGATRDTIGKAFFSTPASNVSVWTRFSLPITYRSSNAIDTALWIFSSSINQANGQVGSQLYIDDLGLVIDSASGINNIINTLNITVGPNPAKNVISINNCSNINSLWFTLMDVTGRKIEEKKISTGLNLMELAGIEEGLYIYLIKNEENALVKTGRIVVQN